jgi:hypothetical protein
LNNAVDSFVDGLADFDLVQFHHHFVCLDDVALLKEGEEGYVAEFTNTPEDFIQNANRIGYSGAFLDKASYRKTPLTSYKGNIIFKVDEGSVTSSVAGLNEFHTKTPEKTQTLQYAELDFHAFKKELRHCFIAYGVIKKANDALLYLSNEEAAIAVFTGPYKFVYRVTVSKVSGKKSNNGSLYRFSPRDLLSIKIKDLIGATSTRLEIIKYQNGELKLGVYYSLEDKLPYRSIAIEKNESELPSMLAMLESFNKNQGNTQHEKQEVQEDLFAFYADEGEEY